MDCYKPTTTCAKLLILSRTSDINDIFKIWLERVYIRGLHYWWVFIGSSLKSATSLLYQMLVEIHLTPWNVFLLMNMSTVGYLLPWLVSCECILVEELPILSWSVIHYHVIIICNNMEMNISFMTLDQNCMHCKSTLHSRDGAANSLYFQTCHLPKSQILKIWLICLNYAN